MNYGNKYAMGASPFKGPTNAKQTDTILSAIYLNLYHILT